MQSRLDSSLTSHNRLLEDIFSVSYLYFNKKSNDGSEEIEEEMKKPIVTADITALVAFLIERRELDPDRVELQLSLDGGQGILKVCLLVYEAVDGDNESTSKRIRHCDGVAGCKAKLTPVKRLMVVAAASGVQENWYNIKCILDKL